MKKALPKLKVSLVRLKKRNGDIYLQFVDGAGKALGDPELAYCKADAARPPPKVSRYTARTQRLFASDSAFQFIPSALDMKVDWGGKKAKAKAKAKKKKRKFAARSK